MNYPEGKMVPVDSPLAKGESHHGSDQDKGEKEDASMSATDLRAVHDKSCELVKMIDAGHLDEKLSKGWVSQS